MINPIREIIFVQEILKMPQDFQNNPTGIIIPIGEKYFLHEFFQTLYSNFPIENQNFLSDFKVLWEFCSNAIGI